MIRGEAAARWAAAAALILAGALGASWAQQQGTVNLSWLANSEPDLAGYNLYASTDSSVFSSVPDPFSASFRTTLGAGETTASIQLTAGVTWFLALTAVDLSGNESGFSSVVSATPSVTPTVRSLSPTGMEQGDTGLTVTISGDNFTSGATVDFGPGITVNSVNSTGAPTTLVASVSADPLAQVFSRKVTVTNVGGGVGSKLSAFSVQVDESRLDLDFSSRIDNADFLILLLAFPSVQGDGTYTVSSDFDVDGRVDGADLSIFFAHFGQVGPF